MHPFIIDAKGNLFVGLWETATNALRGRRIGVPKLAGPSGPARRRRRPAAAPWRYDANKTNQKFLGRGTLCKAVSATAKALP